MGAGQQVDGPKSYNNVDLDHVYMEFQQPFHTWSEGEHVVKEVIFGTSVKIQKE